MAPGGGGYRRGLSVGLSSTAGAWSPGDRASLRAGGRRLGTQRQGTWDSEQTRSHQETRDWRLGAGKVLAPLSLGAQARALRSPWGAVPSTRTATGGARLAASFGLSLARQSCPGAFPGGPGSWGHTETCLCALPGLRLGSSRGARQRAHGQPAQQRKGQVAAVARRHGHTAPAGREGPGLLRSHLAMPFTAEWKRKPDWSCRRAGMSPHPGAGRARGVSPVTQ